MKLILDAKTKVQDLVIDYIEVRLKDGREVSLNWDESEYVRSPKGFAAWYKGVYFGEEYANGQIKALEGLKVLNVQTYSEKEGGEDPDGKELVILSMEFQDGEEDILQIDAPLFAGDTFELTRDDVLISDDMEVDCDIGQEITTMVETWFDVDRKFGLDINDEDGTWLNIYAKYNPFEDTLRLECEVSADDYSRYFDYEPVGNEEKIIKEMIAEKIMELHGCTPKEFCRTAP